MDWLEVSVEVDPEVAESVVEVLSRYAPQGVAVDMGDGQPGSPVTVLAYLELDEAVEMRRRKVEESLWHLSHISAFPPPEFKIITDQDWTAVWKARIPIIHVGQRLVIKPAWKPYTAAPDEIVLDLDPGVAFGTGLHPSTQLCIQALETLCKPGMRVLDLGTGTGVLALTAAMLGASEILAVDYDSKAITATQRNAQANKVSHVIHTVHGSLSDVKGAYDIVLANILAPTIIQMAQEGLATRVHSGGMVVASGILLEQAYAVTKALEHAKLKVTTQHQSDDWIALLAQKL